MSLKNLVERAENQLLEQDFLYVDFLNLSIPNQDPPNSSQFALNSVGSEQFISINDNIIKEAFYLLKVHVNIGEPFTLPKSSEGEAKKEWEANSLNLIMKKIAGLLPEAYR